MRRINHLKILLLGLGITGLVGCGFNQGMQAKKTKMPVAKFSALYGELPTTKSGSQVVGVSLLSDEEGRSLYADAKTKTDIFDGTRSHDVNQGERVRLIAEIETRDGSLLYLAQQDLGLDLRDGYMAQATVDVVGDGDGAPGGGSGTTNTREDAPPITPVAENAPPVENTPAPSPAPSGSCPDIAFSFFDNKRGKQRTAYKDSQGVIDIMGHNFRYPEGFADGSGKGDGGYRWFYNIDFSSGMGAKAVAFNISNKTTGESFSESRVNLDGTYGAQTIPFVDFIPQNDWYSDKVRFDIAFLNNREDATPDAQAECGVDTELSSPIVLDFSEDQNFRTIPLMASKAKFDLDANGVKEQTGWIARATAFLALDRNNNGQIDNGSELFGNHTQLVNGEKAKNGYDALAELLVHGTDNSKIDSNNIMYDNLILWFDYNADGISQFNEMMHLDQAGVTAIETVYETVPDYELDRSPFANQVKYSSKYFGSHCPAQGCATHDVWFSTISPVVNQAKK